VTQPSGGGAENSATVKSKAAEGLTKVQSSASETMSKATSAVSDAASNVQGRTGRMIHAVQCEAAEHSTGESDWGTRN